jgi:hypothetical protein
MEQALGTHFEGVRIHTDGQAAQAAGELSAAAFTKGQDVFFGAGNYQPETMGGRSLLAHELTHVAQQAGNSPIGSNVSLSAISVSSPGDQPEREAATVANRVATSQPVTTEAISVLAAPGAQAMPPVLAPAPIIIPSPDITLFDRMAQVSTWSGSSGEIPIFTTTIDVPHIGPIDLSIFAQGSALALLAASLGPGVVRNIRIGLDPLALRAFGTAQLYVPTDLTASTTLTGAVGGKAMWSGIQIGRLEGGLVGAGTGLANGAFIASAEVIYDAGDIFFSLGTELDLCLKLNLSLDAYALFSLLSYPVWTGWWNIAGFNWERCWQIAGALSLGYVNGHLTLIAIDFSAEPVPVGDMLPLLLGSGPGGSILAPPPPVPVSIDGDPEMWWFGGERPPTYPLEQALTANTGGKPGTFRWQILSGLPFADFNGAPTEVGPTARLTSKHKSSARDDVEVKLEFTGASGEWGEVTRRFTVLSPDALGFLRNDDLADPTWGYETFVHYEIRDQFGSVLPRNVPINEQWSGSVVPDFAGMDWRRGGEGSATVSPTDWTDHIQGELAGHTPAPVGPTHASAGVAVYHWPGMWQVGSLVIGRGVWVISVTWSKSRGRARHT